MKNTKTNLLNYEYIKMKNRESAKRYRERHKLTFSKILKENNLLKEELKYIIENLKKKTCPYCKSLKLDKQCENILKKKENEN